MTLPLLIAMERTGPAEAAFWTRTIDRREQTEDDFRRARELIVSTGALSATLDEAAAWADRAKGALDALPDGEWRQALALLADFAVSRAA